MRLMSCADKMNDAERILAALGELTGEVRQQTQRIDELSSLVRAGSAGRPDSPRQLTGVFALYPQFERDYERLVSGGCISETPQGLVWNRSKQSLAEYFGNQEPPGAKRHHWRDIERLFNLTGLTNSLSRNGDIFKKPFRDYERLKGILAAGASAAKTALEKSTSKHT